MADGIGASAAGRGGVDVCLDTFCVMDVSPVLWGEKRCVRCPGNAGRVDRIGRSFHVRVSDRCDWGSRKWICGGNTHFECFTLLSLLFIASHVCFSVEIHFFLIIDKFSI